MQKQLRSKSSLSWPNWVKNLKKLSGKTAAIGGILMAGWLSPTLTKAQSVANYVFAASSGTYTPLGATATALPAAFLADDVVSAAIPLGFTFNYAGVDYTNVYASSNGFLSFNSGTGSVATNQPSTASASTRPLVAPLWDDLEGDAALGSSAAYETTGTAGSRVFTFQWQNWLWNFAATTPVISFQAKLYEATGKIEFIYQQESGAVNLGTTGGASIGITAVATGAGNFLNLNNATATPTASSTTVTTDIGVKPSTGQIYAFSKPAIDISAVALAAPVLGCFGATETVSVTVRNTGESTLNFATNPLTVTVAVTGTNATSFPAVTISTGTLAPNASQNVVVSTTYNMTAVGTYTFNGTATVTGDASTANNTLPTATRTVTAVATLPQSVNFNTFTGSNLTAVAAGWIEATGATTPTGTTSAWTSSAASQTTHFGSTTIKLNMLSASRNEWIVSPKVTAAATTVLQFKAAVTEGGSNLVDASGGMAGTDDKVQVMISTDCGITFTPVSTIDATNNLSNTPVDFNISLATYAGQNIIVAFKATDGPIDNTNDYDFHIDDVFLGTQSTLDVGATALVSPAAAGCYTATENVTVAIRNFGSAPINFATTPVTVTVAVTGAATQTLTTTVNTGTLAPGASQNVTIPTPLNMTAVGTYNLAVSATATGDTRTSNDALPSIALTVSPIVTLPQILDFTGFTGANLPAAWREASGATMPIGTTSTWVNDDFGNVTGAANTNGVSAKINLDSNVDNVWIISPMVTANATTAIKFDLALTVFNATTAATMGSDDELKIMVSTNCGATFTAVKTFNASTPISNTGQIEIVDLSTYAGQNIIVAFFATEGTVDNTQDNDLFIDNLFLGTPPPLDMGVSALVAPVVSTACFTNAETVTVTVKNFHQQPIDFSVNPTTVTVNITGAITQTLTTIINTGTLASGATQNVTLGTANLLAPGTYTFNSFTTLNGDGNPGNNALAAVSIVNGTIATFPTKEDFETFTVGTNATGFTKGWTVTPGTTTTAFRWNVDEGPTPSSGSNTGPAVDHTTGTATGNYVFTESSEGATAAVAELISPCINLAGQTSIGMEFWYHMYGAAMGTLNVDVFNGTAWVNGAFTITGQQQTATTDPWRRATVDLSAYSGTVIKVRFRGERGTTFTSDMAVDDVLFYIRSTVDVGAVALAAPGTIGCFSAAEPVIVTITNSGLAPLDFSVNPATVTVNVTGAATQTLTATVNTGTLAIGATQNVTVGTLNMTANGTYTFNATATATGDLNTANFAMTATTRTLVAPVTLPQTVSFTGFTGANLTALFANWYEATGATAPSGTTSAWLNTTGLGGTGNITARINLYSNAKNDWIVGPKVTPTANTAFRFKAAVTEWNSLVVDASGGMTGTDDKVQVMVSTDCGVTFTPIYTLDASNNLTNILTEHNVSLASYAGQNIILAIRASEGTADDTPDYDFHIDDLFIGTVPPIDLGATALASPVTMSGCYGPTQNVVVTVKNFGSSPLDFATTNATVTVNVTGTGGAAQTLTATLNSNALNNGAPLPVFGTINVPVGVLNMSGLGTYIFNGTGIATGDGLATNDAMPATTITVAAPVAGTASVSQTTICQTGTPTLSITGNTGGNIQWQQATSATGPFTNIAGGTTSAFVLPTAITQTTYFYAIIACGTNDDTTNVVSVTVNNPLVSSVTGGTICGSGPVTLTATPSTGTNINWFSAATGGTSLATGNTYAPTVTATTTYYAEASVGVTEKVGKMSTTGADGTNTGGGLIFNASNPFTLDSVVVYSALASGGSLIVQLKNSAGTVLQTATVTLPAATTKTAFVVPLNFSVPAGTGLRLEQSSALALYRDYTASAGISYPYTSPSQLVTITDGTLAGYYYSFYRWSISNKCASARTAVVATVNPLPTPTITGLNASYCANAPAVTLTGSIAGSTFTVNGTAATSFNPATLGAGPHTVIVSSTDANNCTGTNTVTVIVNATPATPTITQNGGTLTSSSATGNQWFLNGTAITGATSQNYVTTANGNYTVVVTTNGCASATSAVRNVTNTGISDAMAGMSVNVYPNPAKGSFNVKLSGYQKDAKVVLYNLAGQKIATETVSADGNAKNIDIKGLAAGTYLLKVTSDKGVQVNRLIVQ